MHPDSVIDRWYVTVGYWSNDGPVCCEDSSPDNHMNPIQAIVAEDQNLTCWLCGEYLIDIAEDGE